MSDHPACENASHREDRYMTGKQNETRSMDLNYPMVDLLTGTIMPLMYLNTLAVCCLLPLTSPWLFMQTWTKGLQNGEHREDAGEDGQPAGEREARLRA